METITAHIVVIYLTIQTKYILLDKKLAALGVDNKLETFWDGFASGTDVFLGNFGPSDRPLRIPPKVLPGSLDQLLSSSTSWSSLPRSIFDCFSLFIPLNTRTTGVAISL